MINDFGPEPKGLTMRDLGTLFTRAANIEDEFCELQERYNDLERKYDDLLDSSVKQANESSGLLLAAALAGNVVNRAICTRAPHHSGPCNGFPKGDCPVDGRV